MKTHKRIILLICWINCIYPVFTQSSNSVQINPVNITVVKDPSGIFDKILWGEGFVTDEIGNPELPVHTMSFVVPVDAHITGVSITSINKQKMKGLFSIYPVQPPIPTNSKDSIIFVQPNKTVYGSNLPYPGKTAEIISDNFYQGYRIVTVKVYPFEYIPENRELYYCDINFSVNYTTVQKTDKEIINPKTQNLRRYELNKSAIRHMVQNPEDIETYDTKVRAIVDKENIIEDSKRQLSTTSAFNTQIPDYIIITNEQLRPAFETLAN